MSRRRRARKNDGDQDFELNIASVIDCFTVLITYLLVSASFISLGVLDVSVAANGPSAEMAEDDLSLSVALAPDKSMLVKLTGKENKTFSVSAKPDGWNFDGLADVLKPIKDKWPALNTAVVSADSAIEYKAVVAAVETTRKTMPTVFMGDPQ